MATRLYTLIGGCRSCGNTRLEPVLDLGQTPLADRLLEKDSLSDPEPICSLTVSFCGDCGLLQICETVDPEVLFSSSYPYYSSISPSLLAHFRASAEEVMQRRALGSESLVLELASNDGYQLKNYLARGIPVLGIDPAPGPAREAVERGIETRVAYFGTRLAEDLAREGIAADVIHANNVLAHVADTNGFVAGIATLLKEDGEAIIECPYVKDLVDHCEFDTIYHQHLCYFSLTSLAALFRRHGLFVNRVERTAIHGGSLRVFVEKVDRPDASVLALLELERSEQVDQTSYYAEFGARVRSLCEALRVLIDTVRADGHKIAGYGAAAKACTLMSTVGIDSNDIEFIVDKNPHKQGWFMPGNHLPIRPVECLLEESPDYLLLLSWNFADEIMAQQAAYQAKGGRFIVPIPIPSII